MFVFGSATALFAIGLVGDLEVMLSIQVDALRSQSEGLKRKSCELTDTLRARQNHASKSARRKRQQAVRHEMVGSVLFARIGADFEVLREYSSKKIHESSDHEEFVERVASRFLDMPQNEFVSLLQRSEAASSVAVAAERFLLDYRVHSWIGEQNSSKDVAPSVGDTLRQAEDTRRALRRDGQLWLTKRKSYHGAYKWVQRFRSSWRLRCAKAAYHEMETVEKARFKVGVGLRKREGS